jgi:hypothetical protein
MARATEVAWCRRSERTATHEVVDHPWPQEVQQPRVVQQETPEPRVALQASSRPHRAQIPEGLPMSAEPRVAQQVSVWPCVVLQTS